MLKNAHNISSQKSLAKEIGFSVGKINYVLNALNALTEKGIQEKMQLNLKQNLVGRLMKTLIVGLLRLLNGIYQSIKYNLVRIKGKELENESI